MKKLLSWVLALMLLMLCPAMAESGMQTLHSPKGDYHFEVPDSYIPMDSEFMVSIMSTPEMQQIIAEALGLEDASMLSMYFELLKANNMTFVYTSDFMGNLNVQSSEASLSMDLVILLKTMMDEAMIEQYASMGIDKEAVQTMDVQMIGSHRWYGTKLNWGGMSMQTMMTIVDGWQYTVTFTDVDAAVVQHVLESFRTAGSLD